MRLRDAVWEAWNPSPIKRSRRNWTFRCSCSNNQAAHASAWEAHPHTSSQRRWLFQAPSGETSPAPSRTAKSKARWKSLSLVVEENLPVLTFLQGKTILKYSLKCFHAFNKRKKLYYHIYCQSKYPFNLLLRSFLIFNNSHPPMKSNFHKCFTEFKEDRSLNLPNIINKC